MIVVLHFVGGRDVVAFDGDSARSGGVDQVATEGLAQRIESFLLGNA